MIDSYDHAVSGDAVLTHGDAGVRRARVRRLAAPRAPIPRLGASKYMYRNVYRTCAQPGPDTVHV